MKATRILTVDWSGAAKARDQQIYVAEVLPAEDRQSAVRAVVRAADREAVAGFLSGEDLRPAKDWTTTTLPDPPGQKEAVVAGLDFAFGFPACFALPEVSNHWAWDQLAEWCVAHDQAENLDKSLLADPVASSQLRIPGGRRVDVTRRLTEDAAVARGHHPESVLNLVGARQVGRGSIRGIPILHRLREKHGVAVWPFDSRKPSGLTLVEVFPRLSLSTAGSKEAPPNRVNQLTAWRKAGIRFENQTDDLTVASPDAMDAVAAGIGLTRVDSHDVAQLPAEAVAREGWIVGTSPRDP